MLSRLRSPSFLSISLPLSFSVSVALATGACGGTVEPPDPSTDPASTAGQSPATSTVTGGGDYWDCEQGQGQGQGQGQAPGGEPTGSSTVEATSCTETCSGTCSSGGCVVTLATAQSEPVSIATDGTNVYWANFGDGSVVKAPVGGGAPTTLATLGTGASAVAVSGGSLYWNAWNVVGSSGNPQFKVGEVLELPVAGGTPTTLTVDDQGAEPDKMAIDEHNIYWSDFGYGGIWVTPRSGGASRALVPADAAPGASVTSMQVAGGQLYWVYDSTGPGASPSVYRVPVGGGAVATVASWTSAFPTVGASGLALDASYAYVTIGANTTATVLRAPLAGGDLTTLYTSASFSANGVAVTDVAVYWTQSNGAAKGGGAVMRAAKDGSSVVTLATGNSPYALMTDGTRLYWSDSPEEGSGPVVQYTPSCACP